jgi:hypothetical protein
MSSIAAPAVHLSAETGTGKSPVSSGTAAGIAKGDFRVHLAVVKTTAKFTAPANAESGTAMPAETDEAATAAVLTGNTSLSAAADTMVALPAPTPQGSGAANAKTPKPAKKDIAASSQKTAQAAPASQALTSIATASVSPSALQPSENAPTQTDASVTTTGHNALQPQASIAVATILKTAPDLSVQHIRSHIIAEPPIANMQTTNGAIALLKTATPQPSTKISDITAQLAKALPEPAPKTAGSATLHVALKPETLGTITVKIQNNPSGEANVTITASQPETLETLKKDATSLSQILTNAGVPEAGRLIDFRAESVAAPLAGASLGNDSASMQGNAGQQSSQNGTGFASSSPNAASDIAPSPIPGSARLAIRTGSSGGVNVIA